MRLQNIDPRMDRLRESKGEDSVGQEAGGRQGGLKITSTLGGNDSVSPRRHGALKYERYDEPLFPSPATTVISFPDGALALISAL